MVNLDDIYTPTSSWLKKNEEVALATVISTWGSSPRQVGGQACDPHPKFLTLRVVSERTLNMHACIIDVLLLTTPQVKNLGCGSNTHN